MRTSAIHEKNVEKKSTQLVRRDENGGVNSIPCYIVCDVHPWMTGKLHVLDHPYYTLTKADGTFELPIVPAGAEVNVMAWHESIGYVLTNKGKTMHLKAGANKFDFQMTR